MNVARKAEQKKRQRNRRWAVILGTVLTIFSFGLRDVKIEAIRGSLDRLRTAEEMHLTRSDTSFVMVRLVDLTEHTEAFINTYEDFRLNRRVTNREKRAFAINMIDARMLNDGMILENVEMLLRAVSYTIPESSEYGALKARRDQLANQTERLENAYSEAQKLAPDDDPNDHSYKETMELWKSLGTDSDHFQTKSLDLAQRCFTRAALVEDSLERSYKYYSYGFDLAFVLGVLANLWGALSGGELPEDEKL